ncbi:hypothetical protein RQP46_009104 [Phenoliferia psychrophenolica]
MLLPSLLLPLLAATLADAHPGHLKYFGTNDELARSFVEREIGPGNIIERDLSIFADWRPPGPYDSRSPCPILNALANHGILPRNGRGISLPMLMSAMLRGVGVGPISMAVAGTMALVGCQPAPSIFLDLESLGKHGVLEHDASLSRSNFKVGNNIAYNETLWNQAMSFNAPGATHWTPQAGAAGTQAK